MNVRNVVLALIALTVGPAVAEPRGGSKAVEALFGVVDDPRLPGCAVSVMRAGHSEFARAWGSANLEQIHANTLDTVFEAGSVSKQFTAAAIAVLVAQGRLSLDDDARRYLPELRDYGVPVTVRQLLTHTSGVRNWDDLVELAGRPREDASGLNQADALTIVARQSGLNFAPGSQYLYSNSNYVLAAVIVERVSGTTFADFSSRELFQPIGMTATQWRDDYTRIVPRRATAYTPDDKGILHIDMPAEDVVGPGGLLTTVGDLQRWNDFLVHPPQAAQAWVRVLTSTHGTLSDGTAINYGLGLEYEQIDGRDAVTHAGATAGYRAYLARVPTEKLSAAVLCNAGALNTEDLGPQLAVLFMTPEGEHPAPVAASGSAPADLAGRYQNTGTRALVTATIDGAGVHFNGGPAFHEVAPNQLTTADKARTLSVTRGRDGAIERMILTRIGNSSVELRPVPVWSPSQNDLAKFSGSYFSADVDATWRIELKDGALQAWGPRRQMFVLDPIYADAFSARDAYWTLVFGRDGRGAINAIRFYKTRTLGVLFQQR